MNTTETFWEVNGQSLQTFAWNITTLGGDRLAPPPVRGDDIEVPYMVGSVYVPKVVDSQTITLGMWVIGANADGTIPLDEPSRRTFDHNWRMLRRLLWRPRRQFTLTKRFWVLDADLVAAGVDTEALPKVGAWTLYSASAQGSYAGGLNPSMNGTASAVFTVDIKLQDPFFYSEEISIPFSMTEGGENPGKFKSVPILGDDRTMNIEVDFEGPLTSPAITNETEEQLLYVRYGSLVPDDESATLRIMPFSATHYPSGTPYGVSGNVAHEGDHYWLYLEPGTCNLRLSAQSGTGVATLRYRPAWI